MTSTNIRMRQVGTTRTAVEWSGEKRRGWKREMGEVEKREEVCLCDCIHSMRHVQQQDMLLRMTEGKGKGRERKGRGREVKVKVR